MSKDIRSFFKVISKNSANKTVSAKKPVRKLANDSSDEDIIPTTPNPPPKKTVKTKRKQHVLSSDSEDEPSEKSKSSNSNTSNKLKPVNINDIFSNTPVKQSKVDVKPKIVEKTEEVKPKNKRKKVKNQEETTFHNDSRFEQTLMELDDDDFLNNADIDAAFSAVEGQEKLTKKSPSKAKDEVEGKVSKKLEKKTSPEKSSNKESEGKPVKNEKELSSAESEAVNEKKRQRKSSTSEKQTPNKKIKVDLDESGIDPGQDAYEKRRYSAMLYQKYLNRGGPKHHGMKEIPKGKPDCLKNLCFLRTGVLDSLESEEFLKVIIEHGGRIVHAVSKKVSYVVVGDEPGPSKLEKANQYNIPLISEDELFDMILTKSGMEAKYSKKTETVDDSNNISSSEDKPKRSSEDKHKRSSEDKPKKSPERKPKRSSEDKPKRSSEDKPKKSPEDKHKKSPEIKPKKVSDKTLKEKVDVLKNKKHSPKEKPNLNKITKSDSEKSQGSSTSSISTNNNEISSEKLKVTEDNDTISLVKNIDSVNLSLIEKYKPTTLKGIIGQQGDTSLMNKLKRWLENWYKNQKNKNIIRPSPWATNNDGAYFKCALLSGPPGIGKTTTATLVSKHLGLDIVEFNASDTRNKKLLHEEVGQLLNNKTIAGFAAGQSKTNQKRVLIMDEVDGMAGNEDRGGIQELINLIKNTNVPIICMCNDRNHPKIRSLANYCFDLRFTKPKPEQIRGAMMSICCKEKISLAADALLDIIKGIGCDVRQTLNYITMYAVSDKKEENKLTVFKKDTVLGPWEVVRMVFNKDDQKNMSLSDKTKLFFYDYSLGPLFVQENYLGVQPSGNDKEIMRKAAKAADAISMGDIIDSKIRSSNNWSLLELQAIYSSVLPGYHMSGHFVKQINFPRWLGNNSKRNKFKRIQSEIGTHSRISTSSSKLAIKLDYLVPLRDAILNPLIKEGTNGIQQAVSVMKSYNLLREDLDGLVEVSCRKGAKNPMTLIDSKVKSAFTRTYNKQVPLLSIKPVFKAKKTESQQEMDENEDELFEDEEDEDKDDVSNDAMIKVKKASSSDKKARSEAGSSRSKKPSVSQKGKGIGKRSKK